MAVDLHVPPTPGHGQAPGSPPVPLLPAPPTRRPDRGLLVPLLAAILFGLVALLLLIEQEGVRWTHRIAAVLVAGSLGFGLSQWLDRAFMARRAAILAGLAASSVWAAKLSNLELDVPGLGHLRLTPSVGWPETVIAVAALGTLLTLAVLERRDG